MNKEKRIHKAVKESKNRFLILSLICMKRPLLNLVSFILPAMTLCCKHSTEITGKEHKINLGHHLFFEKKLSRNQSKSCASCHSPEFAFSDGYRRSVSAYGENLLHNAPGISNLSGNRFFDWDNPAINSLEQQIKRPLYNVHPTEMGFRENDHDLISFFNDDSLYRSLFKLAYRSEDHPCSTPHIEECLVAFVRSLNFRNSRYDQYMAGDHSALNVSELRGMKLFNGADLKCNRCHQPPMFTLCDLTGSRDSVYANTGLYNVHLQNKYPAADQGLIKYSRRQQDDGKYKIPSLRNIMLTAPYMHDGSVGTLEEVIEIYARGGRNVDYGEYRGDGALNKHKHALITGFTISPREKNDLLCFLSALTDTSYLSDPRFTNPFQKE